MKEAILKLLKSNNKDDILLAANLMFSMAPDEALHTVRTAYGHPETGDILTNKLPEINHYEYYKYGDMYVFFGNYQVVISTDSSGGWPINYKP